MIFDASSIFVAVKSKKLTVLKNGVTVSLARYELGNAVWKEVFSHKTLSVDEGIKLLNVLMKAIDQLEVKEPDPTKVLETACKYGITFYDASYVQLAIDSSNALVTEDDKLRKKVSKDVKVLSVSDL